MTLAEIKAVADKARQDSIARVRGAIQKLTASVEQAEAFSCDMDATLVLRDAVGVTMAAKELSDLIRTTNTAIDEARKAVEFRDNPCSMPQGVCHICGNTTTGRALCRHCEEV